MKAKSEYMVKATYIGLRMVSESQTAAAFQVGKDVKYFRHVKWAEIGREYWLERKDKSYACGKFPDEVNPDSPIVKTPEIRKWAAKEAKDVKEIRRRRDQKKAAKDPELAAIVSRLGEYCDGLSFFEIKEVIEYCIFQTELKLRKVKK